MKKKVDILGKLFGSSARVKIMKLFIANGESDFDIKEVGKRAIVSDSAVKKELKSLVEMDFIKERKIFREFTTKTKGTKKKRVQGYVLNQEFEYLIPLKNLLLDTHSLESGEVNIFFKGWGI